MTKLNLKVIDMENSIVEFAKAVIKTLATDLIQYIYSKSTLPSRITVRRD